MIADERNPRSSRWASAKFLLTLWSALSAGLGRPGLARERYLVRRRRSNLPNDLVQRIACICKFIVPGNEIRFVRQVALVPISKLKVFHEGIGGLTSPSWKFAPSRVVYFQTRWCQSDLVNRAKGGVHVETLVIHDLGFSQNYYTFTLILLVKMILCRKFHWTKFNNFMCFHMGVRLQEGREELRLEIGVGLFLRSGDHDEFARTFFTCCTSFFYGVLYTPGLVKNHIL